MTSMPKLNGPIYSARALSGAAGIGRHQMGKSRERAILQVLKCRLDNNSRRRETGKEPDIYGSTFSIVKRYPDVTVKGEKFVDQ